MNFWISHKTTRLKSYFLVILTFCKTRHLFTKVNWVKAINKSEYISGVNISLLTLPKSNYQSNVKIKHLSAQHHCLISQSLMWRPKPTVLSKSQPSKHCQLLFLRKPTILVGFTWPTFGKHQHGCIPSRWHPRFIGLLLSAGQWVRSAFSSPSLKVLSKHSQCITTHHAKPDWMLSNSHMEQQSIMGWETAYVRLE